MHIAALRRRVLALLLLSGVVASAASPAAWAQPAAPRGSAGAGIAVPAGANGAAMTEAGRAVVRVEVPISTTRTQTARGVQVSEELSTGAGVVLSDGRVLTAYHLFRKAGLTPDKVGAARVKPWEGGETTKLFDGPVRSWNQPGSRVHFYPDVDLAVISPANPVKGVRGAPLAGRSASPGDSVRTFMTSTAPAEAVHLRSAMVDHALNQPMLAVSGEARPGDSGGPVFNERGELCAILVGGGPPFAPFTTSVDWTAPAPFKFSTEGGQWRTIEGPTFLAVDVPAVMAQAGALAASAPRDPPVVRAQAPAPRPVARSLPAGAR